jgi:hypothetical protein
VFERTLVDGMPAARNDKARGAVHLVERDPQAVDLTLRTLAHDNGQRTRHLELHKTAVGFSAT